MKESRKPYEFSGDTKKEALVLSEYKCDLCGRKDQRTNRLQIHHLVAIYFARETGIPCNVIKSIENCMSCCSVCHNKIHLQENRYQYEYLAWYLLGIDVHPDYSRDDWRKDPNHPINKNKRK